MNHPTHEVDELFDFAREAMACDDYEQAVIFLRKALELAPLRKDIRRALANALSQSGSPLMSAGDAPSTPPAAAPASTRTGLHASLAPAQLPPLQEAPHASKSLWVRPPAVKATPAVPSLEAAAPARSYTPSTHGSLSLALQEEDEELALPEVLAEEPSSRDEAPEAVEAPKPRGRKKGAEKRVAGSADFEDVLADLIEAAGKVFSPTNRPKLLYGSAYAAVCLFVGTACYKANKEFGGELRAAAAARQSIAAAADTPKSQPRLMLGSAGGADALNSNPPVISDSGEAALLAEAHDLMKRQQFDGVIARLQPTFESGVRTPAREEIRSVLAHAYDSKATSQLTSGEVTAAVKTYREALKLLPNEYNYRLHLANALYHLGSTSKGETGQKHLSEAITIASDLVKLDASNVNAHQVQARSQQLAGRKNEAARAWKSVLALAPQNSKAAKEAQAQLAKLPKVS